MRLAFLAMILLGSTATAEPSAELLTQLRQGGYVLFLRHTSTDFSQDDSRMKSFEDCATQRNLTDEGRGHAKRIGQAFKERKVPVERVLSSPWCRCIETARLAFGEPVNDESLSNLFGRSENNAKQVEQMKTLASTRPKSGNLVLVSHGSTIVALTGVSPGTGEMVVVTPQGNGKFSVAGRLEVK